MRSALSGRSRWFRAMVALIVPALIAVSMLVVLPTREAQRVVLGAIVDLDRR